MSDHAFVQATDSVNMALLYLTHEQRERVLLAAAVLYGIIKPGAPEAPPASRRPYRENGKSIQARVCRELATRGRALPTDIAAAVSINLESVRAALSKLVAAGKARRVSSGVYAFVPEGSQ